MGNACVTVVPVYPEKQTPGQQKQYDSHSASKEKKPLDLTEGRETEAQLKETPELKSHGVRVLWMVGAAVDSLGALDILVPVLEGLGERHYTYGVKTEYFEPVVEAVQYLLENRLGARYTPRVKKAWAAILGVVGATMSTGIDKAATKSH